MSAKWWGWGAREGVLLQRSVPFNWPGKNVSPVPDWILGCHKTDVSCCSPFPYNTEDGGETLAMATGRQREKELLISVEKDLLQVINGAVMGRAIALLR